ncbi:MAG TPA: hypothetical protein VFX76_19065 [Roseiflexaceae bacterium]|nr:hypothetical protein [Roseiflexaceae bacterium]
MIADLPERIAALPDELRLACERLFHVAVTTGHAEPPPTMYEWVERHFGALADVRDQTIVRVVNRLTLEGALFNPLRARRPIVSGGGDAELETRIATALAAGDIFAEPLRDTTADVFGRIRGQYCVTASNVAKYDGWHGVVIFDEPRPLHFDAPRLRDYLDTALRWMAAAHSHDAEAIYPLIFWNCLPKSGATIMHGHMQLALGRGMHYTRVEAWRRAAHAHTIEHRSSYFDDLFAIHQALGLAVPNPHGIRAFAHLTPLRNREIVMFAGPPQAEDTKTTRQGDKARSNVSLSPALSFSLSELLADALHAILRGLIERQGVRAFNLAIALPPLRPDGQEWAGFPILARLGDRGAPLSPSSDLGAVELYGTGCITADPFDVAVVLRTENQEPRTG